MSDEEKLFCDLVDYFIYLDCNKKSYCWNIGYFRKLKRLLQSFGREYMSNHFKTWVVNLNNE